MSYVFGYRWYMLKLPEGGSEQQIEEIKQILLKEKEKLCSSCRIRLKWDQVVKYLVHIEIEGPTKEIVEKSEKELSRLVRTECDKREVTILASSGRVAIA